MGCYVGIDIGAVSATAAVLFDHGPAPSAPGEGFDAFEAAGSDAAIYLNTYRRTRGRPLQAACDVLQQVVDWVGAENVSGVLFTGGAGGMTAEALGGPFVNEFRAIAAGLSASGCRARTVFEMGGETSKYLLLERNDDGSYSIIDYATNGDCAAGTGSFIDQQAGRLKYKVEEVGEICLQAERSAQVAGRCSVFAKSDMIHAQQKGYNPAEVLKGLCDAVARNFRLAVIRSHNVEPPVAFIGGLTANEAVVAGVRETFGLDADQLCVPPAAAHVAAIGAAVCAAGQQNEPMDLSGVTDLRAAEDATGSDWPTQASLSMDNVVLLRDRVAPYPRPDRLDRPVQGFLGIDIGSVSTNLVVIDDNGRVACEIYTRTQGRPIEVVTEGLAEIHRRWGEKLQILGVGTTGSGRELIGQLVGADTVNDEITAHKTGATFVGQTMLDGRKPDTIFEIGGQDSKYISLQDGVVVDFTMNEACAAGTGSFLEERAEELDIAIKGEFAELALASQAPVRLGERCTVFMERDVNSYLHRGAAKRDLVAGLAYSVVYNYINRVVRGRHIGDCIFFQGGTAYNDAVAAAFAAVCGKEVIVPPHNGVIGAIGAALLAREKATANQPAREEPDAQAGRYVAEPPPTAATFASKFRGYDLQQVDYQLREFTCRGCSNHCRIQEFTVEGEKTYWGDKCSDRFRKAVSSGRKPVIDDLVQYRMDLLLDDSRLPAPPAGAPTVGIPLCMFAWEQLPFWRTLLAHCGFATVLSDPTNSQIIASGLRTSVAEPCFPIIVAHGHVMNLIDKDVDHVLLPNIVNQETRWNDTESQLCPWHQTLPFVIRRAPAISNQAGRLMTPTVRFAEGRAATAKVLREFFRAYGVDRKTVEQAAEAAFDAQDAFSARIGDAGREALTVLEATGEVGIVLVGRPYNVHDAGMNLSVARKMRELYGVNCIPLDMLPTAEIDVRDVNDNMYWNLGRNILAAAKIVGAHENLHIIYITNFKCGPDSFIKHFVRNASGKPFLSLQFDGHSNDAGIMTRCEAYLDSKGVLRGQFDDAPAPAEQQAAM
mgnify:FL=1